MTISNDRSALNVMIDDPTDKKIPMSKTFVVTGVSTAEQKQASVAEQEQASCMAVVLR
jgi:hypothetical protein